MYCTYILHAVFIRLVLYKITYIFSCSCLLVQHCIRPFQITWVAKYEDAQGPLPIFIAVRGLRSGATHLFIIFDKIWHLVCTFVQHLGIWRVPGSGPGSFGPDCFFLDPHPDPRFLKVRTQTREIWNLRPGPVPAFLIFSDPSNPYNIYIILILD